MYLHIDTTNHTVGFLSKNVYTDYEPYYAENDILMGQDVIVKDVDQIMGTCWFDQHFAFVITGNILFILNCTTQQSCSVYMYSFENEIVSWSA